jgi:hypothetical protein
MTPVIEIIIIMPPMTMMKPKMTIMPTMVTMVLATMIITPVMITMMPTMRANWGRAAGRHLF